MIFILPKSSEAPASSQTKPARLELLIHLTIQRWIAFLMLRANAEYAENKDPRDRPMQTGQAWKAFQEFFGANPGPALLNICIGMNRYTRDDSPLAPILFNAAFALYAEENPFAPSNPAPTNDPITPKNGLVAPKPREGGPASLKPREGGLVAPKPGEGGLAAPKPGEGGLVAPKPGEGGLAAPKPGEGGLVAPKPREGGLVAPKPGEGGPEHFILLTRHAIERWCDWLDATIHLDAHQSWHRSPISFDPDPEKRELAYLGVTQRFFAEQSNVVQALWHHCYSDAVERYKNSPKWPMLGQAMASNQQRPWQYREVDTAIISLWPLLKRHNWTYRDLMLVVRKVISNPQFSAKNSPLACRYPCEREQDFTVHCRTVLGLRKTGRGKSSKNGQPPGHDIALEIYAAALCDLASLQSKPESTSSR